MLAGLSLVSVKAAQRGTAPRPTRVFPTMRSFHSASTGLNLLRTEDGTSIAQ